MFFSERCAVTQGSSVFELVDNDSELIWMALFLFESGSLFRFLGSLTITNATTNNPRYGRIPPGESR